jgi:hypothetical protein
LEKSRREKSGIIYKSRRFGSVPATALTREDERTREVPRRREKSTRRGGKETQEIGGKIDQGEEEEETEEDWRRESLRFGIDSQA